MGELYRAQADNTRWGDAAPPLPPYSDYLCLVDKLVADLYSTVSCDHSVNWTFRERVKRSVWTSHEVRLQQISAFRPSGDANNDNNSVAQIHEISTFTYKLY